MSKKILSLLLVLVMLVGCFASCGLFNKEQPNPNPNPNPTPDTPEGPGYTVETFTGEYVYKDSVNSISNNWNPHTYQTNEESYPIGFVTTGLYDLIFNDGIINTIEGKDPFKGWKFIPEMAADFPVDVTEEVKAAHPEYAIPESATAGYAYKISLNPNAVWADGTPINAETYVYSMMMLLDPDLQNYRATDYFDGSFSVANAKNYYYQGSESYNGIDQALLDAAVKGEDGNYYSKAGNPLYVAVAIPCGYLNDNSLYQYVSAYGSKYFDTTDWNALLEATTEAGVAPLNDTTYGYLKTTITGNPAWGEDESYLYNYIVEHVQYADNYSFDNVGLFASGDYEITLVLSKSLAGFNLLYNLGGNWIVHKDLYEANIVYDEDTGTYSSTYNTSLETTMSYGPYKMDTYISDMSMSFVKNDKWYGYTDGKHLYQDPEDGKVYPMYQTTKITTVKVAEADTVKMMFLKGELMGYGLQAEDFEEYRDSDYCYATPSETIFFFVFNGYMDAIQKREANEGFKKETTDLETMTLNSFRRAWAVSFDKEAFCTEISPSRSGGYGIIGNNYIYDPETGAKYRDTDQAKKALCEFYSIDISAFDSLDEAVDSITGYDVEKARELYTQAFYEALEKGYITDNDGDGKSDQTVTVTYSSSEVDEFIKKTIKYFNDKLVEVTAGTPFENKIVMIDAGDLGDPDWSDMLKAGETDTCLCGWSGSALDPFGLTDLYTNPNYQYDAKWFKSETVSLTLDVTVDGATKTLTMNLRKWSDALNGATVVADDGNEYCFGDGIADVETRLNILAAIETEILGTYNYIPMLQDGTMSLLSKQVYYVIEDYNPVLGRGGIAYLKYNYEESEWAAYVESQGGKLTY